MSLFNQPQLTKPSHDQNQGVLEKNIGYGFRRVPLLPKRLLRHGFRENTRRLWLYCGAELALFMAVSEPESELKWMRL
jgi:hypothetical protein